MPIMAMASWEIAPVVPLATAAASGAATPSIIIAVPGATAGAAAPVTVAVAAVTATGTARPRRTTAPAPSFPTRPPFPTATVPTKPLPPCAAHACSPSTTGPRSTVLGPPSPSHVRPRGCDHHLGRQCRQPGVPGGLSQDQGGVQGGVSQDQVMMVWPTAVPASSVEASGSSRDCH